MREISRGTRHGVGQGQIRAVNRRLMVCAAHLTGVGLAGVLATFNGPANAQDAPQATEIERVEVTGSNLRKTDAETSENVQIITQEEIQRSGATTVAQYLRAMPGNLASSNETFTNSFAPGASQIALRGLSPKNTLVLLDGQRMPVYGFAQNLQDTFVDLNVIPIAAIDRIEVLKTGGSAIYGSDAVAGVVNIILKTNYQGGMATAGIGSSTEGGGLTRDASATFGFGSLEKDGYNVTLTASGFKRDELLASQRSYTAQQDYTNQPNGFLNWVQSGYYLNDANPTTYTALPGCGANGQAGKVLPATAFPQSGASGTVCAYNPANQTSLIPGTDRENLVGTGTFKITPTLSAFGDIFVSQVQTWSSATPASLGPTTVAYSPTTGIYSVPNTLPIGNPSNPNPGSTQDINYVFQGLGGRDYVVRSNTARILGGLKGTNDGWNWETSYGHSENSVVNTTYNALTVSGLSSAIANGTYNFNYPALTPLGNNIVGTQFSQQSTSKLDTLGFKANRGIFDLPAGTVQLAVGAEYRHESMDNQPDPQQALGNIVGYGLSAVNGARSVDSLFAELDIPILKTLDIDLAARDEHYSDLGNNISPQGSIRWQPSEEILLRASASRGFRAPSLPEMAHATATSFVGVTDPLDPLQRPGEQIAAITQGNPNLKAEMSTNYDLGIVFSPTKDLSITADWYRINVQNAIAAINPQSIVDNPGQYPNSFNRTPGGLLNYVVSTYSNLYEVLTTGVDLEVQQVNRLPGAATLTFAAGLNYIDKYEVTTSPGGPLTNFAGSNGWLYLSPLPGGGPVPHLRGNISATWENPTWVTRGTVNYTGNYSSVCAEVGACAGPDPNVGSMTTLDLYGEYRVNKRWRFYGSVINVFNRRPPFDVLAALYSTQPFDNTLYDAMGRFVDFHLEYKFN